MRPAEKPQYSLHEVVRQVRCVVDVRIYSWFRQSNEKTRMFWATRAGRRESYPYVYRKNSTLVETCVTRSIGQVVAECKVPAKLSLSTDMCRCCDILFITLCNFVFFSYTDLGLTATALLHNRAVMTRKIFTGIFVIKFLCVAGRVRVIACKVLPL